MLRKIREFLHTYPYALLLIYPVVHVLFFFLLNQLPLEHHLISCSLDAKIPFCEWFIIPYFIWFIYLFGGMIFFLFVSREDFLRMAIYTMGGLLICLMTCLIYPTAIDFRPTAFDRSNPLIWLVKFIYASDEPWNVCPSMHCYGAIGITVAICKSRALNRRWYVPAGSILLCLLICLSTMLIKQHSFVDFLAAAALAFVLYPVGYCVHWKCLQGPDAALYLRTCLRAANKKGRNVFHDRQPHQRADRNGRSR